MSFFMFATTKKKSGNLFNMSVKNLLNTLTVLKTTFFCAEIMNLELLLPTLKKWS